MEASVIVSFPLSRSIIFRGPEMLYLQDASERLVIKTAFIINKVLPWRQKIQKET